MEALETAFYLKYYRNREEYTKKPNSTIKFNLFTPLHMRERSKKYNNFTFENQEDTLICNKIIEKSEVYIAPRVLIIFIKLKRFSNDCELQNLQESLIRDMIVIGPHNKNL